jgi:hypothetical protein
MGKSRTTLVFHEQLLMMLSKKKRVLDNNSTLRKKGKFGLVALKINE